MMKFKEEELPLRDLFIECIKRRRNHHNSKGDDERVENRKILRDYAEQLKKQLES